MNLVFRLIVKFLVCNESNLVLHDVFSYFLQKTAV